MEFLKVTIFFYDSTGELKCNSQNFTLSAAANHCTVLSSLVASGIIHSFNVYPLEND